MGVNRSFIYGSDCYYISDKYSNNGERGGVLIFFANLRPETVNAFQKCDIQPAAYLLSAHRATPSMIRYAHKIRDAGLPLFADNGTKALIDEILEKYKDDAKKIKGIVREFHRKNGRVDGELSVPETIRCLASDLASKVVEDCTLLSDGIEWGDLLSKQLEMNPTHLVAQEDFSVACLIALNLERNITGWQIPLLEERNRRSLRLFKRVADEPRCRDLQTYAVLSAMDYNTALAAGRIAAEFGVENVALGVAGITLDQSATDSFTLGNCTVELKPPVPNKYSRLAQIVRGIADGYEEVGKPLKAFHALGLGAATMFPILAAAFNYSTLLTVDATSPIHDAVRDRVFYSPKNNADRLSQLKIARNILNNVDWDCLCPFCNDAKEKYGHDTAGAKNWWESAGRPNIEWSDLDTDKPLGIFLPLFAKHKGEKNKGTTNARIAHNHWVLDRITEQYLKTDGRREWAYNKIDDLLKYESTVTSRGVNAAKTILKTVK